MDMRKTPRMLAAAAAITVSVAATSATAEEVTLSAVNFVPNVHAFGKPMVDYVEAVNEAGKGLIQIDLKASGSMSPFQMGDAVKSGAVDMANLPATFYQNLLPIGDALKLASGLKPQGPHEPDAAWKFFNRIHEERVNAHYLTTWGFGVPFHAYFREGGPGPEKIRSLDWSGVKMRITPIYRAFFNALGADTTQMKPADVYTALERGSVDGYGWPIWDIQTPGWDEVTAYRVDPGFYETTSGIIINLDTWNSLNDEQRELLQNEAWELAWELYQKVPELNAEWTGKQEEAGVEAVTLEGETREQFIDAAYEAGWAEAMKLAPEDAKEFKAIVDAAQ